MHYYLIHHKNPLENYDTYVGSCKNYRDRWNKHKNACHSPNHRDYNSPVYRHIRANEGIDNYTVSLIDVDDLVDTQENKVAIANRESYFADEFDTTLNFKAMTGLGATPEGVTASKKAIVECRLGCGRYMCRAYRKRHETHVCINK